MHISVKSQRLVPASGILLDTDVPEKKVVESRRMVREPFKNIPRTRHNGGTNIVHN